jgi:hypothetical protein
MEHAQPNLINLFAQLGEPNDEASIKRFFETHRPLRGDVRLHEASFWSPSQSAFLRDALLNDAEWAEAADQLNTRLHNS